MLIAEILLHGLKYRNKHCYGHIGWLLIMLESTVLNISYWIIWGIRVISYDTLDNHSTTWNLQYMSSSK